MTAYRPYVTDHMKRFEYPDDWVLADDPVISSETASGYIEGKYRSRRRQQAQRRNGLTLDAGAPAQRDHMEHLAEDGHSQAMYRLAKAAVGGTDEPDRAFRLAHRAAVQGHRPAMRLLADLYRRGHGVEADEARPSSGRPWATATSVHAVGCAASWAAADGRAALRRRAGRVTRSGAVVVDQDVLHAPDAGAAGALGPVQTVSATRYNATRCGRPTRHPR